MKYILFLLATFMLAGKTLAQEVIQSTQLADFHAISLSGNMSVQLIKSDQNALKIDLFESVAEKLKWGVDREGVLQIALRPTTGANSHADVRIYYRSTLQKIAISECRVATENPIESHILLVDISGGGTANMAIKCKDLDFLSTGNSAATLSGTSKYLTIKAGQRSGVDARNLVSVSADVTATVGTEVFVNANDRLTVSAASSATVWHAGTPDILKTHTKLGGGIHAIDAPPTKNRR